MAEEKKRNPYVQAVATFDAKAKSIIGGGSSVTLTATIVTATTATQTVPAGEGTAFNSVEVEAVTASIDANITPENIKSGVTILGVEGALTPAGQ